MSYNPSQPFEQWQQQQQQPIDSNQQQLQTIDPQATTSRHPSNLTDGGGNYQQRQQSYSWTDGNAQGQHHQSQQRWSWQGHVPVQQQLVINPIAIALQSPPPIFPPLLQNDHHLLHQQMHQNATSHFQQVQAHHHQQVADMHRSMSTFAMASVAPAVVQSPQQPQIAYQQVASPPPIQVQSMSQQGYFPHQQQQTQIEYQHMSSVSPVQQVQYQNQPMPQGSHFPQEQAQITYPSMSPPAPVQRVQYHQEGVRHEGLQQLPPPPQQHRVQELLPPATSTTTAQPQGHSSQTTLPVASGPSDHRVVNLEKRRKVDVENSNRAGARINKRLRDLEQSNVQAQQDHDAKDREVRRLQEQLVSVERQRRQDAERNSKQLADLVRSQAASPAASSAGAFDVSALQTVIRETQAHQLTAQDIERVIEEQVSKRLIGMATKQDIQNAGAQMQGALSKVPAGLSQQEVQQAVNRELNNVMQDVASRVNQQRRVTRHGQPDPQSWQASQDRVQTDFVVEELPDDAVATRSRRAKHQSIRTQKQLPPAATSGHTAAAIPSTTAQRTLAPTQRALESNQSPARSHIPATSQRPPTVSAPVQAQITAPSADSGLVAQANAADNSLVPSGKSNPVVNTTTQGSRIRALKASPAAPDVSENSLAKVKRSVPRATLPSSDVAPPQNPQRIVGPVAQKQLPAPPAATRQESPQQPNRSLQQIEPQARQQGQLEAPSTQSEASSGVGQKLVLQGREVARKPPPSKR
jgi:hypothetical protein